MVTSELNWIGGSWCGAASGHGFETLFGNDRESPRAAFPRSGVEDLLRALEAGLEVAGDWHARATAERAGFLTGWLEEFAHGPDTDEDSELSISGALALSTRAAAHERRAARRAGERLLYEEGPPAPSPGVALARARAGESFVGLFARALPALADGLALVLLSDPHVPQFALELARAAERAGLPPGVLALLHDDGETALRAGLAHQGFARVRLSGSGAELARFRRDVERRRSSAGFTGRGVPFGAGVVEVAPARLELALIRNASRVVREDEPVEAAGEAVARAAFGRVEAFSGQRAGQVARVFCHEQLFSEFTAALLEAVEDLRGGETPLPVFDPELARAVERRIRLGLDEGATLILGPTLGLADSRRSRAEGTLEPTIFTNAEPRMRLVRAARPAPVLCLLRTAGDEEGAALAQSVDELLEGDGSADRADRPEEPGASSAGQAHDRDP